MAEIHSGETVIELRLAAVEHAVEDLRRRVDETSGLSGWIEKIVGSITDEAAFLEALELGRAFRAADRPSDDDEGRE